MFGNRNSQYNMKPTIGNQKGGIFIGVMIFLVVMYVILLSLSFRGWGYPGYYGGYAYGPSFWYFGGPRYYGTPSVRRGSTGGPNRLGGGPRAGK